MTERWLIIGVGNPYRQDDGVGPAVADRLRPLDLPVDIALATGEGGDLMHLWHSRRRVMLIDAVQAGGAPGCIYRFDGRAETVPGRFFNYSTHAFSLAEAVALGKALAQLPETLIIFGIEGKRFGYGESISAEVEKGIETLVDKIGRLISQFPDPQPATPKSAL